MDLHIHVQIHSEAILGPKGSGMDLHMYVQIHSDAILGPKGSGMDHKLIGCELGHKLINQSYFHFSCYLV